MKMKGEFIICLAPLSTPLSFLTDRPMVMPTNRLRGGAGPSSRPSPQRITPRHQRANLNCGGRRRLSVPTNYDEFQQDVVKKVQDIGNYQKNRLLERKEYRHSEWNRAINSVDMEQEQRQPFDESQFANMYNQPECSELNRTIRGTHGLPEVESPSVAAHRRMLEQNLMDEAAGYSFEEDPSSDLAPLCVVPIPESTPIGDFFRKLPKVINTAYGSFLKGARKRTRRSAATPKASAVTEAPTTQILNPIEEVKRRKLEQLQRDIRRIDAEVTALVESQNEQRRRESEQQELLAEQRRPPPQIGRIMNQFGGGTHDFLTRRVAVQTLENPDLAPRFERPLIHPRPRCSPKKRRGCRR